MKWVIVALKDWEIGVALPQVGVFFFFLHETFGGGETWGRQILGGGVGLGGGRGVYSQNKGGVALHHQLLYSKDSRIAKKKKKKRPLLFI